MPHVMRRAAQMVWDYSLENIKVLNVRGINNTYHVPLGYDKKMESTAAAAAAAARAAAAAATPAAKRDMDVVFARAMNGKRAAQLAQLQGPNGTPLRIDIESNGTDSTLLKTDFKGAWGEELLALYRRSKVALNCTFTGAGRSWNCTVSCRSSVAKRWCYLSPVTTSG
jgi:hypothetical protein